MKLSQLIIKNFRGIKSATLKFPDHCVLIGDNNTGKSTVFEAIDLVLGPDRIRGFAPIDEHDFYRGVYIQDASQIEDDVEDAEGVAIVDEVVEAEDAIEADAGNPEEQSREDAAELVSIYIEAVITDLNDEQTSHFGDYLEFWDMDDQSVAVDIPPEETDKESIAPCLRVSFRGSYSFEDDDFECDTVFTRTIDEEDTPTQFRKQDKQYCGFLYLRTLRTGSRALSLERGSLLDVILRIKELRPKLWEQTLYALRTFDVAEDPELGISGVLNSISSGLGKYVPSEWGKEPQLRVSTLTREHLRRVITAFMPTGSGDHIAPYYMQGTGTINMLVLSMLSQIAEDKQNVIFAMEEPEIAIPPYAQKQIVTELKALSAQSLVSSHSPYVLEEFDVSETIALSRSEEDILGQTSIVLPASIKPKTYRSEFRVKFSEGLLARRILIAEGYTEASCIPAAARRLRELDSASYSTLEALGICTVNAKGDGQIRDLASLYKSLGKTVYGLCDKQDPAAQAAIEAEVDTLFMHEEHGIESLVIKNTSIEALARFAATLDWPTHITSLIDPTADPAAALLEYFNWTKGSAGLADFLVQCSIDEIPEWIRNVISNLKASVEEELVEQTLDTGDAEAPAEAENED